MSLTLQFVSESWSPSSAFIRWGSWSGVSHVDRVLPDGRLLGARTDHISGVQVRDRNYARFSLVIQVDYAFTPSQIDAYDNFLFSQIGKPYDRIGIVDFFVHGRHNRDWRSNESWFCSELQARASECAGNPFLYFDYKGTFKIMPSDLLMSPLITAMRLIRA